MAKKENKNNKEYSELYEPTKSSPALKRAQKKYYDTLHPFAVRFKPGEEDLYRYLNAKKNKAQYIKNLIVKDMGYKNWAHYVGLWPTESLKKEWDKEKQDIELNSKNDIYGTTKDLQKAIDNDEIPDDEWEKIEKLFNFEGDVSTIACVALIQGALPYSAWTKDILTKRIEEFFWMIDIDLNANWNKYTEKELKDKFLIKSFYDDPSNKINQHIDFYRVDNEAVMKHFDIENVNPSEILKRKNEEAMRKNSLHYRAKQMLKENQNLND